jgi:hypothetical protein
MTAEMSLRTIPFLRSVNTRVIDEIILTLESSLPKHVAGLPGIRITSAAEDLADQENRCFEYLIAAFEKRHLLNYAQAIRIWKSLPDVDRLVILDSFNRLLAVYQNYSVPEKSLLFSRIFLAELVPILTSE